jgi:hypothetical protein
MQVQNIVYYCCRLAGGLAHSPVCGLILILLVVEHLPVPVTDTQANPFFEPFGSLLYGLSGNNRFLLLNEIKAVLVLETSPHFLSNLNFLVILDSIFDVYSAVLHIRPIVLPVLRSPTSSPAQPFACQKPTDQLLFELLP